MQYEFFVEMQEELIKFGSEVMKILDISLADVLPSGAVTFIPVDVLEMSLLSFLLGTGIVFIIGWNLLKWAVPFIGD